MEKLGFFIKFAMTPAGVFAYPSSGVPLEGEVADAAAMMFAVWDTAEGDEARVQPPELEFEVAGRLLSLEAALALAGRYKREGLPVRISRNVAYGFKKIVN